MPEAWTYAQLVALVEELSERNAEQARVIVAQGERIAELERRLAADLSTSSRPPSSDAPWDKQPAKKRLSRSRSGRKPGKQPGSASASRSLVEDPDETFEVAPDRCARWPKALAPLLGYLRDLGAAPQPGVAAPALFPTGPALVFIHRRGGEYVVVTWLGWTCVKLACTIGGMAATIRLPGRGKGMKSRVACVRITSPDGQRSIYDLSAGRTRIGRATPDGAPELALGPDPYGRLRADPAVGRHVTVAHEQVK